jgi:aminomethyltransferase
MDEEVSALEAGLGWVVKMDKGDFVGRDALLAQKAAGVPRSTIGLRIEDDGKIIPRPHCPVLADGEEVGMVTSGTISPMLSVGIALVRVPREAAEKGELSIRVRGRDARCVRVKKSFV